jgi:hypothetical protein
MAAVVESQASNTASSTTSLTITKPTGTVEGNLLVAFVSISISGDIATVPSGWTAYDASATYGNYHAYYKEAGASEGADYTWGDGSSCDWVGVIFRVSGVSTTPNVHGGGYDETWNTDFTGVAVTTTVANCFVIGSVQQPVQYPVSLQAGSWTDGFKSSAAPCLGVAYRSLATAGDSGQFVYTADAAYRCVGYTLAFPEDSGTPGTAIPAFLTPGIVVASDGEAYSYRAIASGGSITYSLPVKPTGMTIDGATGIVSWTPTTGQIGNQSVTVRATNSLGSTDQELTVVVLGAGARSFSTDAPVAETQISSLPYTISASGNYILTGNLSCDSSGILIEASNVDLNLNGYTITYGNVAQSYTSISTGNGPQSGNVSQAGIVCSVPTYTGAFAGSATWSAKTGVTIRNGTITEGANAGTYGCAILGWERMRDSEIYDIVTNVSGNDNMCMSLDSGNHVHHCTLNSTVSSYTNRSSLMGNLRVTENSTVEYVSIQGGAQVGIYLRGEDCIARYNLIQHSVTETNGYGIETWQHGLRADIHHNWIVPTNGRGIHLATDNAVAEYNYVEVVEDPALNDEYTELSTHGIKIESDETPDFGTGNIARYNTVIAKSTVNGTPTALNVTLHTGNSCMVNNNYFEGKSQVATPEQSYAVAVGVDLAGATILNNVFWSNSYLYKLLVPGTNVTLTECYFFGEDTPVFYDGSEYINTPSDTTFKDCTYTDVNYLSYEFPSTAADWDADQEFIVSDVVRVLWTAQTSPGDDTGFATEIDITPSVSARSFLDFLILFY